MIILCLEYGIMSLIIQLLSLCMVVVYSLCCLDAKKAFKFGFYMMLMASVVGFAILTGGGISLFLSLISFPITGGVIGYVISILHKGKAGRTEEGQTRISEE
jgi:uncharacterized membrane protein